PPIDSPPPGGGVWQPPTQPPKFTGPRVAPRVGPRFAGPIAVAIEIGTRILLRPENNETDYTVKYVDPDSGEELTFISVDELDGYKFRKQKEKREAPGPRNQPPKVEAPPQKADEGVIGDILDPNQGPVEAPGPTSPSDRLEAPATEREPMPREARPLSKTERSI